MSRGGARPGAGRPKGRKPDWMPKSKSEPKPPPETRKEVMAHSINNGISPIDYCLSIMRDEGQPPERRDKMAALALPFTCAKPDAIKSGKKDQQVEAAKKAAGGRFAPKIVPIAKHG